MCTLDINKQYSNAFHKDQSRCDLISLYSSPASNKLSKLDTRKRKRNENALECTSNDTFLLEPYPASLSVKSRTLQPLIVLPRSCLPLSFLDFASSANLMGSTRLFKAHLKALDLEGSHPMVLLARDEESKQLFVLEKEGQELYAVCQVGSWVSIQKLYNAAGIRMQSPLKAITQADSLPQVISPTNQVRNSLIPEVKNSSQKKKRLVIEAIQSMVKKSSTLPTTEPHKKMEDAKFSSPGIETNLAFNSPNSTLDVISSSQSSSAGIFENIKTHYFETLYLSRISLTYFVKGPLSRARAALHPKTTYNIDLNDYYSFLQTLIMPISLLNKKYKDGILNCILNFDAVDDSDDMDDMKIETKKKYRTKTLKLGKNGLYSNEDILIQKWWAAYEGEKDDLNLEVTERTKDELIKTRISELKIRETQLQIVLILEALSLQVPSPHKNETDDSGQAELCQKKVKSRRKSPTPSDLHVLIDIYVDRLCIWQSIAMESLKQSQNMVRIRHGPTPCAKLTESLLLDFCIEVIVPFFSSRLPDQCALISEKLGVPVITPPNARISKDLSISNTFSRPGAATKRSIPPKPQLSLKQALTRDKKRRCVSQGHGKAIALMRSATLPIISSVKKDNIEVLPSLGTAYKNLPDMNIVQTPKLKSLSQREGSLTRFDLGNNLKEINKANIDSELKNAISIIRKPSRQNAVKETADFAVQRTACFSQIQTSKKPSRNKVIKDSVQIFATPKSNRTRHIYENIQNSNPIAENNFLTSQKLPSISKATPHKGDEADDKNSPICSIQATPSRAPGSKFQKETLSKPTPVDNNYLCQSPSNVRRSSAQLFGSLSESFNNKPDKSFINIDTSIKHQDKTTNHISKFLVPESHKENQFHSKTESEDNNIYQILGWDEDFG